ncbi:methylmalonyl-CoA epimerase [Planctomycetota bacterium]
MIQDIDHIAIAVNSLQEGLAIYRDCLGMELKEIEEVPDQQVKTAVLMAGDRRIELLEATSSDSPVGKFLQKYGPGIHHIAVAVEDIETAIAACQAKGMQMIDQQSRIGAGGAKIAFLHPRATGGVLLELTQR